MGIIPACAGSTKHTYASIPYNGDHPRMCGEHTCAYHQSPAGAGSSPHVRGARGKSEYCQYKFGIIPACAGSTYEDGPALFLRWDHPRMCGEHTSKIA